MIIAFSTVPFSVSAGGDGQYEMWGFDGSDDSECTFIDGDGYVDNLDASMMLKYDAGIIDSFQ